MAAVERSAEDGSRLRFPASRALGDGLFELRISLDRIARRITFYFAADRRIVLLTTYRKQSQNERAEVRRDRQAIDGALPKDMHPRRSDGAPND